MLSLWYRKRTAVLFSISAVAVLSVVALAVVGADSPGKKSESQYDLLLKDLDQRVLQIPEATAVLKVYEEFLEEFEPRGELLAKIKTRIDKVKEPARQGMIRFGAGWASRERVMEARQNESQLIQQALGKLSSSSGNESRELLLEASRKNPDGAEADFLLGVIYCCVAFDHLKAEEHFRKVISRRPGSTAALINLSIAEIKQKKWQAALTRLQVAALSPSNRLEVVQNVGRVSSAGAKRRIKIEPAVLQKFSRFYEELTNAEADYQYDPDVGWLFCPLMEGGSYADEQNEIQATGVNAVAYRTLGFCVAPGFIISHRDAGQLENGRPPTKIRVQWQTAEGELKSANAQLIQSSATYGLTLFRSEECDASPVPVAVDQLQLGEAVRVGRVVIRDAMQPTIEEFECSVGASKSTVFGASYRMQSRIPFTALGSALLRPNGSAAGLIVGFPVTGENLTNLWGLSSVQIKKFLQEAKCGVQLTEAPNGHTSKSSADITSQVILIEGFARNIALDGPTMPRLSAVKIRADRSIEDPSCTWCGGTGKVDCENRNCNRGGVSVRVPYETTIGMGSTARVITNFKTVQERCDTCGGNGYSECPYCNGQGRETRN